VFELGPDQAVDLGKVLVEAPKLIAQLGTVGRYPDIVGGNRCPVEPQLIPDSTVAVSGLAV
jgi:hypothetical protein